MSPRFSFVRRLLFVTCQDRCVDAFFLFYRRCTKWTHVDEKQSVIRIGTVYWGIFLLYPYAAFQNRPQLTDQWQDLKMNLLTRVYVRPRRDSNVVRSAQKSMNNFSPENITLDEFPSLPKTWRVSVRSDDIFHFYWQSKSLLRLLTVSRSLTAFFRFFFIQSTYKYTRAELNFLLGWLVSSGIEGKKVSRKMLVSLHTDIYETFDSIAKCLSLSLSRGSKIVAGSLNPRGSNCRLNVVLELAKQIEMK